jgi:transcriptional regulator with XRE-family HTH domain
MTKNYPASLRTTLAENVRAFRKEHGYSQEKLADLCELHRTYIGSVEREERNASLSTLVVLARSLKISVPELLTPHVKHEKLSTPNK